ncbi:MAG: signal recognition particle-docking protein FtsY [Gammaproteobacteria bacterium]|nr:signal recognition particle-docking protein FtsY [Gammaproteobacteria bacterium]
MLEINKDKQDSDTDGFFQRLRNGLNKTREGLLGGLANMVSGSEGIGDEELEEIESRLLMADLGIEASTRLMQGLTKEMKRRKLSSYDDVLSCLRRQMVEILMPVQAPIEEIFVIKKPFVVLVIGVNGVGKTTTIGKLTNYFKGFDDKVLLAAGDTFRAAAIEQLESWGSKNEVPVVSHQSGSDSAAVIYDALQSAKAKECDVVIADTAGRLHNKDNLMQELKKIRRTISKFDDELDLEVLLVIDAGTGQNAISQLRVFQEAVGVTGIALTKLDGTAKGGVIFALAETFGIPVRFVGVGEQIEDFRAFHAESFVDAMLDIEK